MGWVWYHTEIDAINQQVKAFKYGLPDEHFDVARWLHLEAAEGRGDFVTPWLQRRVSSVAALAVIVLASAIAVGVTTILYQQLGF